jgi:hypothetical protein
VCRSCAVNRAEALGHGRGKVGLVDDVVATVEFLMKAEKSWRALLNKGLYVARGISAIMHCSRRR